MAVFEQYAPGLGSVGNYQVSGTPWITGSILAASGNANGINTSTQRIQFPFVTKEITIANLGTGELNVHLDSGLGVNGTNTGNHMFIIPHSGSTGSPLSRMTFDIKTKEIYISTKHSALAPFAIYASLTRIDRKHMFELTGSGVNSEPGDTAITP